MELLDCLVYWLGWGGEGDGLDCFSVLGVVFLLGLFWVLVVDVYCGEVVGVYSE